MNDVLLWVDGMDKKRSCLLYAQENHKTNWNTETVILYAHYVKEKTNESETVPTE